MVDWLDFFESADLTPADASDYAIIFERNKIKRHALADLTKDYLQDMGITAIGDIIAILKHAKKVTAQEAATNVRMRSAPKAVNSKPSEKISNPDRIPPSSGNSNNVSTVATKDVGSNSAFCRSLSEKFKQFESMEEDVSDLKSSAVAGSKVHDLRSELNEKKQQKRAAPDFDVVYTVTLPKGTTERSKQLLTKAKGIAATSKRSANSSKNGSSLSSVFSRLGTAPQTDEESITEESEEESDDDVDDDSDEEVPTAKTASVFGRLGGAAGVSSKAPPTKASRLHGTNQPQIISLKKSHKPVEAEPQLSKKVSFSSSVMESISSPTLESDLLAMKRKQSALQRLGQTKADIGQRIEAVSSRSPASRPTLKVTRIGKQIRVEEATVGRSSAKPVGNSAKLRITPSIKPLQSDVFSRLG